MRTFFNFRLTLILAFGICMGIISAYALACQNYLTLIISLVLAVFSLGVPFIFNKKEKRATNLVICAIIFVVCVLGFCTTSITLTNYQNANLNSHYYSVTGRVEQVTTNENGSVLLLGKVHVSGEKTGKLTHKVAVYVNGINEQIDLGSKINFDANLIDRDMLYEGKISAYNIRNKVKYYAQVDSFSVTVLSQSPNIFERANIFIRNTLKLGLQETEFSVAYAMLTGNDSFIDDNLLQNYRQAGVAHIFAVSGLHIGFLATALGFIINKTRINKKIGVAITILVLFFYAGVCGFSASSVRACIMCSVYLISRIVGFKYDTLSAIGLAGLIILVLNPIELFCVGFQLSFAVVIGIAIITKSITNVVKKPPKALLRAIATVVAAQLFSIPVSISAFGQTSIFAVMANIAFVPIASVVFTILIISVLLGGIFTIPQIALFIPNYLLKAINFVINLIDYKAFIIGGFTLGVGIIIYYFLLCVLGGTFNLKKLYKTIVVIVLSVSLVGSVLATNLYQNNRSYLYAIGEGSMYCSLITTPTQNLLIVNKAGNLYTTNKLVKVASKVGVDSLDYVILTNTATYTDVHGLLTKLQQNFEVENLFYAGEYRQDEQTAIKYFFERVNVCNFADRQTIQFDNGTGEFALDGKSFVLNLKGVNMAFYSQMDDKPNFAQISNSFDICVAVDYCQKLSDLYPNAQIISYVSSPVFKNAQNGGAFCFKIA